MEIITADTDYFKQAAAAHGRGELTQAEQLYLKALQQNPQHLDAMCNLGYLYVQKEDYDKATETVNKAIAINPEHGNAYNLLGIIASKQGNTKQAVDNFMLAINKGAANQDTFQNLGFAATEIKDYLLAAKAWRSYLQSFPFSGMALTSLMHCIRRTLDWRELPEIERKLVDFTHAKEGEMSIFSLLFSELNERQLRSAAHSRSHHLRQLHGNFAPPQKAPHKQGDKIKVGYISSDMKAHPVGVMTQHLYKNHNREEFEIYAYATAPGDDSPVSDNLRKWPDHFHDLTALSNDDAAAKVRADDLDILVDLSGYTKDHRQEILLRRPAPVIINYLGFIGSMGSDYHDFIVADQYLIPQEWRHGFSETPLYLSCAYAYERLHLEPLNIGTRADHNLPEDKVIVGCFHQAAKINPTVFNAWMRVMQRCPNAHLWVPSHEQVFENNFKARAQAFNIPPERITFAEIVDVPSHQGRYEHIDIVADTFPYNGGITSTDALYNGVPIVTCPGRTMISRVGASLLLQIGMKDFIAKGTAEYIQKLSALIEKPDELRAMKPKIKEAARKSVIFNGQNMARELEEFYRRIVASRGEKANEKTGENPVQKST